MPILEAMSCDIPVITSRLSAMPEIAGDAAIFIDPYSSNSIFSAMLEIQTNHNLKKELILKGHENVKRFSWDNSASIFWESIMKTIEK
jgi:glycosyltransferase involved in cell wall biosynthesis